MQTDLFNQQLSDQEAKAGIQKAEDSANQSVENWSELAYNFLKIYLQHNHRFMVEDVRKACSGIVPDPPSQRAWGAIIRKAKKNGLISHIGYQNVTNVKAHSTPASVWVANC